jgi:hypothetical protein
MARGDLNGDLVNDRFDFALFKTAYEEANGNGSFAGLFHVPEPNAWRACLVAAVALVVGCRRAAADRWQNCSID